MDCKEWKSKIPFLVYGELSSEETESLKEHLGSCPACRKEREEYQKVVSLLDAWPEADVPMDPSFLQDRGKGHSRRILWIAMAASLLILVTLAFIKVEVRSVQGGLVVTFGRPMEPASHPLPNFEPRFRDLEGNMNELYTTLIREFDTVTRKQAEQRAQDLRYTRNLVHQVASESAAGHEETLLLLEGLAEILCREESAPYEQTR